ncbi:hypothetical protein MASR1M49_40390 [Pararhodobacter aggregans]
MNRARRPRDTGLPTPESAMFRLDTAATQLRQIDRQTRTPPGGARLRQIPLAIPVRSR